MVSYLELDYSTTNIVSLLVPGLTIVLERDINDSVTTSSSLALPKT